MYWLKANWYQEKNNRHLKKRKKVAINQNFFAEKKKIPHHVKLSPNQTGVPELCGSAAEPDRESCRPDQSDVGWAGGGLCQDGQPGDHAEKDEHPEWHADHWLGWDEEQVWAGDCGWVCSSRQ